MELDFVPSDINKDDYWVIHTAGAEWVFVVRKLIEKYLNPLSEEEREKEKSLIMVIRDENDLTFFLKKKYIPIEQLSKSTGITTGAILSKEYIYLAVKDRPDLPKPTVNYWGEA